jgi:hypothetical protein
MRTRKAARSASIGWKGNSNSHRIDGFDSLMP